MSKLKAFNPAVGGKVWLSRLPTEDLVLLLSGANKLRKNVTSGIKKIESRGFKAGEILGCKFFKN